MQKDNKREERRGSAMWKLKMQLQEGKKHTGHYARTDLKTTWQNTKSLKIRQKKTWWPEQQKMRLKKRLKTSAKIPIISSCL